LRRLLLLLVAAFMAVTATGALADATSPDGVAGRSNDILGIVPTLPAASHNAGGGNSGGSLVYHGGTVLHANTTVPIYWGSNSGFATGYQSTINTYFADVAHDSGQNTNVYSVETQYYDIVNSTTTNIQYSNSTGQAIADTANAVPNDCTDTVAATSSCVSDSAIRDEVAREVPNPDPNTIYFVFTGKGVGSCYSSSSCAFSNYCAYHSNFTRTVNGVSHTWIYANQPYADTVPSACDAGKHPNGAATEADATINVASHEHRESINDTFGSAWYDRRGYEGSDKCAWNFGTLTGPDYNQTINTHHYILQQEWSNTPSGCLLHS
jgi:hypothetical protein